MIAKQLIKQQASPESAIDWRAIGQAMLKQSMAINPLSTYPDEVAPEWENIQISLGWVNRGLEGNSEEISREYTQEQFFEQVLWQGKSKSKGRRLAIIGAAGSGKTTILHKIAQAILEKTEDIPIWISLHEIGTLSIVEYLQKKWFQRIPKNSSANLVNGQESFQTLLNSGRVWLLLDGVDDMSLEQCAHFPIAPDHPQTMLNPLGAIPHQLKGFPEKSRVILTSRNYVWEIEQNLLHNFDIYYPLGFRETEEIKQFIKKWFAHTSVQPYHSLAQWEASPVKNNPQDLAEPLQNALEAFGQNRLQTLLQNPLHLALICRLWQQKSPKFPSNQASLYQQLVREYYQWQAEKITISGEQQQQLNRALGKLALKVLQSQPYSLWLSHQQVTEELGKDSLLLRTCLRLGWLKPIGVSAQNKGEKIYAFFDGVFLDYFASIAIEDWHFFLPDTPEPSLTSRYPIFEQQWKRGILLWLGREDIDKQDKEAFITALINFVDRTSPDNYYGKRAFYLAASGLAEFSESCYMDGIIEQLVRELLDSTALTAPIAETAKVILTETHRPKAVEILIKHLLSNPSEKVQQDIFRLLESMGQGNTQAIEALVQLLAAKKTDIIQWQGADCLGKISPGHAVAVEILIDCLEKSDREGQRLGAFARLEKIGQGNAKAITALVRQLTKEPSPSLQRRIFAAIEKIAYGHATGIANLVQLIRSSQDLSLRRQAAETLEKIDPGNPTAIAVLVELLQTASNEEIRQQVVYSLGEISPGHAEAIQALVNLIQSSQIVFTQWVAISSLGKIGLGSTLAVKTLVNLIATTEQALLRKDAIESLSKIDPDNPIAIKALVELMESSDDESIRREAAESLGKIDPGNPEAIAALTQLLHNTQDEFTCRQAAASLGKIDSGNLEALAALTKLIDTTQDKDVRSLAAESIGEIGQNHPAALNALMRLLQSCSEDKILKEAAKSLGKIGTSHPQALAVLVQLICSNGEAATRIQAAESLIALLTLPQMPQVISCLSVPMKKFSPSGMKAVPLPLLPTPYSEALYLLPPASCPLPPFKSDQRSGQEIARQKILWHCIQQMSYPDFYRAWHGHPTPSLVSAQPADLAVLQQLQASLSQNPQLRQQITSIYIDSREFVDPDSPLIDIYDQMLAQSCPPFAHGLPDTLPKFKLYWHSFCRRQTPKLPILIFWENSTVFPQDLLKALSKFNNPIVAILNSPVDYLPSFDRQDPKLIPQIEQWLLDYLPKKA